MMSAPLWLQVFVTICICLSIFSVIVPFSIGCRLEYMTRKFAKVPGLPILENYFLFTELNGVLDKVAKLAFKYGKVVKINLLIGFPAIVITDLKLIEFLLGTTNVLSKSLTYHFLRRWLGDCLLLTSGNKWRKRRKLLTPAFHFQILEHYVQTFHTSNQILTSKLRGHAGKEPFDVYPYVTMCTLDIICESAMGTKVNAQENSDSDYVRAVGDLCRLVIDRTRSIFKILPTYHLTGDFFKELKALRVVHGFTDMVIKNRKDELLTNGGETKRKRLALLDLLLQSKMNGNVLTDREIRDEVTNFMFAGHDTTASAISFTLYCLSMHPSIQDAVFQEITAIFSDNKDTAATINDLNQMKYLEMVIKETLRLYPPVPVFGRSPQSEGDVKYYDGVLPWFSQLIVYVYAVHRDPEIYPEPEKFDPDRFLPENQSTRHPYSYLAFSAGPRNCIGQKFAMLEMKATISCIVRRFVVKPVKDYEPNLVPQTVLKSSNGILIKLEERR